MKTRIVALIAFCVPGLLEVLSKPETVPKGSLVEYAAQQERSRTDPSFTQQIFTTGVIAPKTAPR